MYVLDIDLETRSECNLKKAGVYRYAEDPTTEITLFVYGLPGEEEKVWDITAGGDMPEALKEGILLADVYRAHNATFDRLVLENKMPEYFTGCEAWFDSMFHAYLHALPGALAKLTAILRLDKDEGKLEGGKDLVHLFCKPRPKSSKIKWADRNTHPEKWAEFVKYAGNDVRAMRASERILPKWNRSRFERDVWEMDQRMNDRGFRVDVALALRAKELLQNEKETRDEETQDATAGMVSSASQRDALLKYILGVFGVSLPDMRKSTLERRLEDPDLPEDVKELIRLRLISASTSGKKWQTLLEMVCADGRLHGTMQCGAAFRTLRWGGRGFQPTNLPRPSIKEAEVVEAIELAMDTECGEDVLRLLYGSVVEPMSSALRGAIVAGEGKKLVAADLASIEGRVLAYLAGEEWKLRAYREVDEGVGFDMYVHAYARTFGVSLEDVGKAQRQLGKPIELSMGYAGGVGAGVTFAAVYRVDLAEVAKTAALTGWAKTQAEDFWDYAVKTGRTLNLDPEVFIAMDAIKRQWRRANGKIVQLWHDLDTAFRVAVVSGRETQVGHLAIDKKGKWVRMRLPSGRYVNYPGAQVDGKDLSYLGLNTYTRKWQRLKTYGGKLAENATQAFSRDVFAHGVLEAEKEGYLPVLLVHDELVAEVPDSKEFTAGEMAECMCRVPVWAPELPLAADGYEGYRYKKED